MNERDSLAADEDELRREDDPDDLNFGGPSSLVSSLKAELFDDLTTDDVCHITGLDKSTVLKYLKDGTIEGYQLGRSWRVPPDSLRKYKEYLIAQAKRAAAETRLERECEYLQSSQPGVGWATARCPRTGSLILVQDEEELDADAWMGGFQQHLKTGRKVGHCAECSYSYEGEMIYIDHHFGARTIPEQQVP